MQIDVLKADRHCTAAAHSAKAAAHPGDQRQAFSRSNNQQPSAALPASAESEAPLHVHVEHVADSGDARGGHPHEKNPRQAVDLFWTSSGSVIDADTEPISLKEQQDAAKSFYEAIQIIND